MESMAIMQLSPTPFGMKMKISLWMQARWYQEGSNRAPAISLEVPSDMDKFDLLKSPLKYIL